MEAQEKDRSKAIRPVREGRRGRHQERHLHIRAERRKETKVEDKNYYRSEIHYGAFHRSLPLPPGAKEEEVKAT